MNRYNRAGKIPLHIAATKGNRNIAKTLLDNGETFALLSFFGVGFHESWFTHTLKGTIVDLPDNDGETALLLSAYNGHEPVVRLLLDYKGNRRLFSPLLCF